LGKNVPGRASSWSSIRKRFGISEEQIEDRKRVKVQSVRNREAGTDHAGVGR
jgi:hypothetical protein